MSVLPVGFGSSGSFSIANSLRFRGSATAYLSRTFGTPTDNKKWTWSGWVKRGNFSGMRTLFSAGSSGTVNTYFAIYNDNIFGQHSTVSFWQSFAVLRDASAWYHLVIAMDTANATAALRTRIYLNGSELSNSLTPIPQNTAPYLNAAGATSLGYFIPTSANPFDGYLSDIYFIDGQALTPSSFGETNSNGVWVPKAYTGTYGTNGFHLDFSDATSTTTLGYDAAGSNDWTCNNISLTAGVTYDHMVDTPTNNYATLNPLSPVSGGTLSDGNLSISTTATNSVRESAIADPTLLQYAECYLTTKGATAFGVKTLGASNAQNPGAAPSAYWHLYDNGVGLVRCNNGATTSISPAAANTDTWQIAYKPTTGDVWVGRNNVWYDSSLGTTGNPGAGTNPTFTGVGNNAVIFFGNGNAASSMQANFGQRPFTYTPPTGFKALCTANLPAVAIMNPANHFSVLLHSGTGVAKNVTGAQFQPDLVWGKARNSGTANHRLVDAVRGATKELYSSLTNAESTDATGLTAFISGGFSVGTGNSLNAATDNYVDWLWKAGGAGSSNTAGSITSTVSANTTAGFSIVTYTGTGANATVGHGLGVAPKMVIAKTRSQAGDAWLVWHAGMTSAAYFLKLNDTIAQTSAPTIWNSTAPSSTVFSLGSDPGINRNTSTVVAYCFAEIAGFSKFGSYVGNGSADGPFVHCGFRPRWMLVRETAATTNWYIFDSARGTYNLNGEQLIPNLAGAEVSSVGFDLLSNGFKARYNATPFNTSSGTFIFAAFAEHPSGGSNVAPSPAR